MTDAELYDAILSLPPDLKRQVADFVEFLRSKTRPQLQERQLSCAKGLIELSPNFDEPLEDLTAIVTTSPDNKQRVDAS